MSPPEARRSPRRRPGRKRPQRRQGLALKRRGDAPATATSRKRQRRRTVLQRNRSADCPAPVQIALRPGLGAGQTASAQASEARVLAEVPAPIQPHTGRRYATANRCGSATRSRSTARTTRAGGTPLGSMDGRWRALHRATRTAQRRSAAIALAGKRYAAREWGVPPHPLLCPLRVLPPRLRRGSSAPGRAARPPPRSPAPRLCRSALCAAARLRRRSLPSVVFGGGSAPSPPAAVRALLLRLRPARRTPGLPGSLPAPVPPQAAWGGFMGGGLPPRGVGRLRRPSFSLRPGAFFARVRQRPLRFRLWSHEPLHQRFFSQASPPPPFRPPAPAGAGGDARPRHRCGGDGGCPIQAVLAPSPADYAPAVKVKQVALPTLTAG